MAHKRKEGKNQYTLKRSKQKNSGDSSGPIETDRQAGKQEKSVFQFLEAFALTRSERSEKVAEKKMRKG